MSKWIVILLTIFTSACSVLTKEVEGITFDEVIFFQNQKKKEIFVIDVRSKEERRHDCFIEVDAVVQFGQDKFNELEAYTSSEVFVGQVKALAQGKRIIFVCQYGVRSLYAKRALLQFGVYSETMKGGCVHGFK